MTTSTASSINSLASFIAYMEAEGAIVSTCDITGIRIPGIYEQEAINAPYWATLTAIFSRFPETGEGDISVWASSPSGEEYYASGIPDHAMLHCLQRFGDRNVAEWVTTQIELYRADINRLNEAACPEGYYINREVDCLGLEWLDYRKPWPGMRVKSCPHQYWLLR